jgi:tRNA (cmo5U34)-methyltransferase
MGLSDRSFTRMLRAMTTDTIRYDATHAAAYDAKIRKLIPGYALLHALSLELLDEALPERATVLVAGSGTGTELAALHARCPAWQLTGVEPSADMMAQAAMRLEEACAHGRVTLVNAALSAEVLPEAVFDAATALLVVHFLPDDGQKAEFLAALARALRPGGMVLIADLCGRHGDAAFDRLFRVWRHQQTKLGRPQASIERDFQLLRTQVYPVTPHRLAALLVAAGFSRPQPYFQALGIIGWWAHRQK